jgi:hypothetical protein
VGKCPSTNSAVEDTVAQRTASCSTISVWWREKSAFPQIGDSSPSEDLLWLGTTRNPGSQNGMLLDPFLALPLKLLPPPLGVGRHIRQAQGVLLSKA